MFLRHEYAGKTERMGRKSNFSKWAVVPAAVLALWFSGVSIDRAATHRIPQDATVSSSSNGSHPDISGFWEPRANGRGRGTPAKLTPEAQARQQAMRARQQSSSEQVLPDVARYCGALAFPFYLTSSPPWDIIEGPDEIVVLAERQEGSRHIFMDGRSHPDAAHLVPTADGDSIGHWEGDTLVVDTIGLKGGIDTTSTYRGPHQHLIERYRLLDPNRLSVTLTWEDPDVYAEPYTTERIYYRSDPSMYAMEDWCDASDEAQWKSDATPSAAPKNDSK
jgi:hypothetical protein